MVRADPFGGESLGRSWDQMIFGRDQKVMNDVVLDCIRPSLSEHHRRRAAG
jgi:hypothetical protein